MEMGNALRKPEGDIKNQPLNVNHREAEEVNDDLIPGEDK